MNATQQAGVESLPKVRDLLGDAGAASQKLELGAGLSAWVMTDPRAVLNQSTQQRIYAALVPVTTRSFGADMTPYWRLRSREGYLERLAEFVLVEDSGGEMVGWTGYHRLEYDEQTILYLDSTGMVPQRQSKGMMRELMRRRIVDAALPDCPTGKPVYLTARTESPVFYRLMRNLLNSADLYPSPFAEVPADVVECGRLLARWLGQEEILEPDALTLRGAYEALDELYGELPTCGDADLDRLFGGSLGPLDAFLLVGRVR